MTTLQLLARAGLTIGVVAGRSREEGILVCACCLVIAENDLPLSYLVRSVISDVIVFFVYQFIPITVFSGTSYMGPKNHNTFCPRSIFVKSSDFLAIYKTQLLVIFSDKLTSACAQMINSKKVVPSQ
jgi:hypothetical protein